MTDAYMNGTVRERRSLQVCASPEADEGVQGGGVELAWAGEMGAVS